MRPADAKRMEEKLTYMRRCLSVKAFSTAELCEKLAFEQNTVRKYLKLMAKDGNRAYIESYRFFHLRWVPLYRYGEGEDAPMPKMSMAEKVAKEKVRRHRRKAGVYQPVYGIKRAKPTPPPQTRTPEEIAEQREEFERRARAAAIKPHRDPWACLFHGGAAVLAGARA